MNKFKPCPNCGTANITAEGHRPDSTVFCDECGEERTIEEWQDDTAREKILRARLEAAEALIGALDEYAAVMQGQFAPQTYGQAYTKLRSTRAKWEAVNGQI